MRLTSGTIASPSSTARAPPGVKLFWMSTTSSTSCGPGFIFSTLASEAEEPPERGEDGLGIVLVQRVDGARDLDKRAVGKVPAHPLGHVLVEHRALRAAQHERRRRDRLQ